MKYYLKFLHILTLIFAHSFFSLSYAQLCPGGGSNFSSKVDWDNAWIQGCLTGTSCTGGVKFSSLSACESAALDACSPSPSCSSLPQSASDVWFSALIDSPVINISVMQHVSFKVAIQAFMYNAVCSSLVEVGCVVADGPSSGVNLTLSGLTIGDTLNFRIYGAASNASQRTGVYCFCGTRGIKSSSILPLHISNFTATQDDNHNTELLWTLYSLGGESRIIAEYSNDGLYFFPIYETEVKTEAGEVIIGKYIHEHPQGIIHYYRLKTIDIDNGEIQYSAIQTVANTGTGSISVTYQSNEKKLLVYCYNCVEKGQKLIMYNTKGVKVDEFPIQNNYEEISVENVLKGTYFIQLLDDRESNFSSSIIIY